MIRHLGVILFLCSTAAAAFEDAPQIHISEIIPPSLAQSVFYRVEEGNLAGKYIRFSIESDFGDFDVESLPMLVTRIRELSILSRAVNQEQRERGGSRKYDGGKYQVSADSAMDILTRPISTATNVAGQVGRKLEDPGPEVSPEVRREYMAVDQGKDDPVMSMHKRNIASQWGLNVYSSNAAVQEFLNKTASARSAGRIAAGAPAISRGVSSPFSIANRQLEMEISLLVKNKTISELDNLNNQMLSAMHVGDGLRLQFLHHRAYSPRGKTAVIHYLDLLQGVVNRSAFIDRAVTADSESAALEYEVAAMMLAYYHDGVSPLLKLVAHNGILEAVTRNDHILFLPMADIIYWSEENAGFFNNLKQQASQAGYSVWEILTAGDVTEEAANRLKGLGFELRKRMIF